MPAIGITGGISTGKSTFCEYMREILPEAKFFDADVAARSLVELPEVKQELLDQFGNGVFSPTGDLNRTKLRTIVFANATKRRALEQILHPRIRRQWMAQAERHLNSPDFFFADIPLLYETGGDALCERVVVVACSRKVQLARLVKRKSLKSSEAEQMLNSQMPLEEKIKRADHVVWNNGDRAPLLEQAKELVALWQEQSWKKR
jgi:dephospho-CoA kinase